MSLISMFEFSKIVVTGNKNVMVVGQRYDEDHQVIIFFCRDYFNCDGIESVDVNDINEYINEMGGVE